MIVENQKLKKAGFTLIEMVIVMAMIGIVSMATLKLVRFSDIQRKIILTTTEIKGSIRGAQMLALAPPIKTDDDNNILHICGFVVGNDGINSNDLQVKYVLPNDKDIKTCRLLDDISDICGGPTSCFEYETKHFEGFSIKEGSNPVKIFFRSPYGKVIGAGSVIVEQTDSAENYSKTIEINDQGKINAQ